MRESTQPSPRQTHQPLGQMEQVDPEVLEVQESDQQLEQQHDQWVESLTDEQMEQFARRIKVSLANGE